MDTILFKNNTSVAEKKNKYVSILCIVVRLFAILGVLMIFIPSFNPARISTEISQYTSLFSTGFSYNAITKYFIRQITKGSLSSSIIYLLMGSSIVIIIGIVAICFFAIISLANSRYKKIGSIVGFAGSILMLLGLGGVFLSYSQLSNNLATKTIVPASMPTMFYLFIGFSAIAMILSISLFFIVKKEIGYKQEIKIKKSFKIQEKYALVLYLLPVILLTAFFSYYPLWGWRYAFFDYKPGGVLSLDSFVGLKWFKEFFANASSRMDLLIVLRNTFIMSGLGILTSVLPIIFAIFFSEIKNPAIRKVVQTMTTLPYFISWVLVYAFALSIFSSDGFVNNLIFSMTGTKSSNNYLINGVNTWLEMLAWGTWKGLGWSSIIYIAAITGIDQEMYEAASIDGARRWKKIWNITVPSLMPTFSVMLLLSFAGILSNGLEQYLVFENSSNRDKIRVLDLYVYRMGIGTDSTSSEPQIPLATVISMAKSIISVILLLLANSFSKKIRGESII